MAEASPGPDERIRLYVIGAIILIALALFSIIISSGARSSSVSGRCGSLIFQNDRQNCVLGAAVSTKNSTMCGSLESSYADQCYMGIAQNTSNANLCSRIAYENLSNYCFFDIANSTRDPQTCDSINGSLRNECIYQIALLTNNTATCSMVDNGQGALYCNSTIYFDEALGSRNASICGRIYTNNDTGVTEDILQNSSIGRYRGLSLNISQILEYGIFFNQTVGAEDMCYASVAYTSQNDLDCGYIQNQDLAGTCSASVARISAPTNSTNSSYNYTQLLSLCNNAGSNTTVCQYGAETVEAIQTGNVSICKSIPSNYSASCFFDLASKYSKVSYCNYITNVTLNNACIGTVSGLYANNNTGG